jgi:hypothetical protein
MRLAVAVAMAWAAIGALPAFAADPEPAETAQQSASDVLLAERKAPPIPSPITDKFALRATYFQGPADTQLRFDPDIPGTAGTLVDGEDTLGLDEDIRQGRMELMFRFGERFRIRAEYFQLDRSASTVLDEDIIFGNDIFLAGEEVESAIDYRTLSFTFLWSFMKRENFELAAGLGLYIADVFVQGEAVARSAREEESGVAPIPALALDATWRFARRWSVTAWGQYFNQTFDDIDGELSQYHVDVQYRWKPNVAFGVGYAAYENTVEVDPASDRDFLGLFTIKLSGPEVFIRASF